MPSLSDKLVIAISSRALFDLEQSHRVFEEHGVDAYCQYQIEHENEVLKPGVAYSLVTKLLSLNDLDPGKPSTQSADMSEIQAKQRVEVVLISRNSADTGLRVFNSIQHYGLGITRAAFTGGMSPWPYVHPYNAHLFLSAHPQDVRGALDAGFAAATILPSKGTRPVEQDQLRIAFDGDAVLFSDDAERVYKQEGLEAFTASETAARETPLPGGPFKNVLAAIHRIQNEYPASQAPIRTALVTARSAPAHERVIRTLRAWNIRIDEAFFLGGLDKGEFLRTFAADIFFDDQSTHCESARQHVPTGHVPHGVANQESVILTESETLKTAKTPSS